MSASMAANNGYEGRLPDAAATVNPSDQNSGNSAPQLAVAAFLAKHSLLDLPVGFGALPADEMASSVGMEQTACSGTAATVDSPGVYQWSGRESNPRPLHCERSALPTELPPQRRPILEAPASRVQPIGDAGIAWQTGPAKIGLAGSVAQPYKPLMPSPIRTYSLVCCVLLAVSPALAADVRGLKAQLVTELRAGRPVEIAFINGVVDLVEQDELPLPLVRSVMLWARYRQPYPFFYFRSAMEEQAARLKVRIIPRWPS